MRKFGGLAVLLLATWVLVGCEALQGDEPCASDSDCAQGGYLCDLEIGLCRPGDEVNRPGDAGVDAAPADSSIADTEQPDTVTADTTQQDSSRPDSSTPDSSTPDSSSYDLQSTDRARVDTLPFTDAFDSDERQLPGPSCTDASPYFSEDAGQCLECLHDGHCNDNNPCTTDTCKGDNTCEIIPVAGRACGAVTDAGDCSDGGYCGVCDEVGQCRVFCESDGECGGRPCDIDAGLCLSP